MSTPLPAAVPAPAQPRTSMDELMLAMDIVDTLRHEQSLVERELASDTRDDAFVARVKQIYASQGIEVTDALIRKGVEELKQDRFAYTPPPRSFAVRAAEVWVDRWRWAKRSMVAGFVIAIGYGIVAVPNAMMAAREYADYADAVSALQRRGRSLAKRVDSLEIFASAWKQNAPERVSAHLERLGSEYALRRADFAPAIAASAALQAADDEAFAATPEASYATLSAVRDGVESAEREAQALEDRMKTGERLLSRARRFDLAVSRLQAMTVGDAVTAKLADARVRAESALAAADDALAGAAVGELEQFAATLDLSYSLRIVNREGVKSGVWRYHDSAPDGKNYYLVVEAIDAAGQTIQLPVTSEETQQTQTVSRFAIRVPKIAYERVKADKLDNGLIDDTRVGDKRRGELDVEYHVNVAGGAITDW